MDRVAFVFAATLLDGLLGCDCTYLTYPPDGGSDAGGEGERDAGAEGEGEGEGEPGCEVDGGVDVDAELDFADLYPDYLRANLGGSSPADEMVAISRCSRYFCVRQEAGICHLVLPSDPGRRSPCACRHRDCEA